MNDKATNEKPSRKKYVISIVFLLVLIIATCIAIFSTYKISDLIEVIKNVNPLYLSLSIILILAYIFFEGVAMRRIFLGEGIKTGIFANFVYSAIDYYFCAITPSASGGQPMVAYYMKKDNIPISYSSIDLLINTAMFKIVLLTLSIPAIIISRAFVFSHPLIIALYFIGFAINVFLIWLCYAAAFKRNLVQRLGIKVIRLLNKMHIVKKPDDLTEKFTLKMDEYEIAGKLFLEKRRHFLLPLFYNFVQRIAFFSISYFVYLSFLESYPEISGYNYFDLVSIQVLVALCVDSLPLPGGVGISEYLYILLLGPIFQRNGIDILGSAMILTRIFTFYIPLLLTGIITVVKQFCVVKKS